MKTMLFADFLSIRRSLPQSLLLPIAVAIMCALFSGATVAGAIVCAMMPVTIVFVVQLYDDQNDWSGYRLTLPVDRRQVVWGRYLFMALCAVVAFLIGCAIVVVYGLLMQSGLVSQTAIAFSETPGGESIPILEILPVSLGGAYVALMFVLLLLAITLPLLMCFGLTQAIRFVPVAFCIVFILALMWLSDSGNGLLSGLNAVLTDGNGLLWLIIGATVVCCALYLASAALTAKLYATREF